MHPDADKPIFDLPPADWPALLHEMNDPPKRLSARGTPPSPTGIYLTVVGSRNHTDYGRDAVKKLVGGLAGYPITIVSGLALGIDSLAHEAALEAGLKTISFPGSGLDWDVLFPPEHRGLANRIIAAGGCLLSEFRDDKTSEHWTFPQRNRLMAAASQATLIVESRWDNEGKGVGTLITAKRANDYHREVLAVPGSLDNPHSAGPNMLIRKSHARAVMSANDILEELGIAPQSPLVRAARENRLAILDPAARRIVERLAAGGQNKDRLCRDLGLPMTELNPLISLLEVDGWVMTSGNEVRQAG